MLVSHNDFDFALLVYFYICFYDEIFIAIKIKSPILHDCSYEKIEIGLYDKRFI